MGPSTTDTSRVSCEKEGAPRSGQTEPDMRAIGKKTVPGDLVNLPIKMGTTTKEIGYTMKRMGLEFTRERMVQAMKEDGEGTCSTAKVNRLGKMEAIMRVSLKKVSSRASESTTG